MKSFRPWFLLLLALLLPIRGAMAAAMLCPPAGVATQSEVRVDGHAMGHHAAFDNARGHHHAAHGHAAHGHAAHGHAAHDHAADGHAAHGHHAQAHEPVDSAVDVQPGSAPDKQADECGLCSAFCSVTSLISTVPSVQAPSLVELTVFPALSAPAPSFFSDGQDRPPRSV
ncbi:MAG TPA: hypothetical protein VK439_03080 [Rubrivivax sp.]|nr:hypothetical protein [Rubrivivax sp.]